MRSRQISKIRRLLDFNRRKARIPEPRKGQSKFMTRWTIDERVSDYKLRQCPRNVYNPTGSGLIKPVNWNELFKETPVEDFESFLEKSHPELLEEWKDKLDMLKMLEKMK